MCPRRLPSPSFALVSVLALVSLAALSATAFLAAARLERLASRPLADLTRLEMASGTGLAMAMGVLAQAGSTNYGLQRIVTYWRTNEADDLGYLLLGIFTNPANSLEVSYLPAFSSSLMISNALDPASTQTNASRVTGQGNYRSNAFPTVWTNGLNPTNATNFPLLGNQTSPLVAWIPIRQERRARPGSAATTNVQVARMVFFVQDLQGLIDAERMGGSANRTTGTNPAEISLTNLSGTALANSNTASNFVTANTRRLFASVGMLRSAGGLTTNDLRYVATGLRSWQWSATDPTNSFSNRVPPGIQVAVGRGYSNAGQVKFDLNTNVTSGIVGVGNLVSILSNNLPAFGNRGGGMAGPAYLSNLAANLVDYADADIEPTTEAVIGTNLPAWRGAEAIAWPNEIFTRFHFETSDTKAVAGGFQYSFKYKHYLEVWNIGNQDVPLTSMVLSNSRSFLVRIPPLTLNLSNASFGPITRLTLSPVAGSPTSLKPGEFGMLESPTTTLTYLDTSKSTATNVQFQDWNGNSSVILTTNLNVVSATRMGQLVYNKDITATNLYGVTAGVNFATGLSYACQSTYRADPPNLKSVGGDPRAQLFLGTWPTKGQVYVNYSSPGGLNWEYGNRSFSNGYVNGQALWADGGTYRASDLGTNPTSYGTDPADLYKTRLGTWSTNLALSRLNNTGSFSNICELGNLFDPMQWEDSTQLPVSAGGMPGLWTNLSAAATAVNTAGGRVSLRIGRPEYTRFAFTNLGGDPVPNMGMSAAALLDLFRAGNSDGFTGGGKINLNTAPSPVLAALAGGCRLTNDPVLTGVGGSGTNFPVGATMTNAFARGVMRFRQIYPFYSPSQLNFISPDSGWPGNWPTGAVFGNTNQIAIPALGSLPAATVRLNVTAANDAAIEEWFSKIHGLSGVDSLNFRCYVIAQLTDANGNPRGAPHRKYYQIYTAPNPAALTNAALPLFRPVVVEEGTY